METAPVHYEKQEKTYSIREVAQMQNVTTQTIRNKIKQGEIIAVKEEGAYGPEWRIPAHVIDHKDLTTENIDTSDAAKIRYLVERTVSNVVSSAVKKETEPLNQKLDVMTKEIDIMTKEVRYQNKMLLEYMERATPKKKKPWWKPW